MNVITSQPIERVLLFSFVWFSFFVDFRKKLLLCSIVTIRIKVYLCKCVYITT